MEVTVQLRLTVIQKPFELALETLKARIRRGEVAPTVLIRDRVLTDDEWWTIDNLNLFHRNAPVVHPPGDHLVAKQAEEKLRDAQADRASEQVEAYAYGNLICECLELGPLNDLLQRPGVLGATRFWVLPSFEPEAVFTFLFERELIHIDAARGETQIWGSLSHLTTSIAPTGLRREVIGEHFDPSKTQRTTAIVSASQAPEPLKKWSLVLAASEAAPSCHTGTLDGIGYRHQLRSKENAIDAQWNNPSGEHTHQMRLIRAYRECLELANLIHFLGPSHREGNNY